MDKIHTELHPSPPTLAGAALTRTRVASEDSTRELGYSDAEGNGYGTARRVVESKLSESTVAEERAPASALLVRFREPSLLRAVATLPYIVLSGSLVGHTCVAKQ